MSKRKKHRRKPGSGLWERKNLDGYGIIPNRKKRRVKTAPPRKRKRKPNPADRLKQVERIRKYHEYLKSDRWAALRLEILERDGYKCCECGSSRNLHVHHTTYKRIFDEQSSDLITLCRDCHKKQHKKKKLPKKVTSRLHAFPAPHVCQVDPGRSSYGVSHIQTQYRTPELVGPQTLGCMTGFPLPTGAG